MMDDLAQAIMQSSQRLGLPAEDLATIISYETGGTFDPWKAGPTTQWGQHRGLIQWGEPQRQQYGVTQGMPNSAQMQAVERYLADAGFKPGMGILDAYSAINAGRVGRYNASDAHNGGAPGTVADKVMSQFAPHRQNAQRLLGGLQPAPQQGGIAQMYGPAAAPQQRPAQPAPVMQAVADFGQRQEARQAEEEAEQLRRAALFDPQQMFGVFG